MKNGNGDKIYLGKSEWFRLFGVLILHGAAVIGYLWMEVKSLHLEMEHRVSSVEAKQENVREDVMNNQQRIISILESMRSNE